MSLYEVILDGMLDSQEMKTVLTYDVAGSTDFQLLADAIRAELQAGVSPLVTPSCSWTGITVREVVLGAIGIPFSFTGGVLIGSNADGNYNARTAANVRKLTGSSVKPTQGRIFQSGIPTNALNDDGFLTSTFTIAMSAAWELMRIIEFDGNAEAAMHILATNPAAPNTQVSTPVTSYSTRGRTSIQSRRNFNT